jgi:hypothetical protein
MHKVLDDTLFRKKYPEFRFTPMADGIRETVSYYKKNLGVNV